MVKRQVAQGLMSYRDPDGVWRHALKNENIDVHADHVDEFDRVNDPEGHRTPQKKQAARKATPRERAAR